jgi:hypothetical protein
MGRSARHEPSEIQAAKQLATETKSLMPLRQTKRAILVPGADRSEHGDHGGDSGCRAERSDGYETMDFG